MQGSEAKQWSMEWSRDRRASRGGSRAGRRAGNRAEEESVLAWTGLGGFIHRFAMGSSCNVCVAGEGGSCCRSCHVANMARQFGQEPSVGANLLTEFACDVATRAVFFASIFVVFSFISFYFVGVNRKWQSARQIAD